LLADSPAPALKSAAPRLNAASPATAATGACSVPWRGGGRRRLPDAAGLRRAAAGARAPSRNRPSRLGFLRSAAAKAPSSPANIFPLQLAAGQGGPSQPQQAVPPAGAAAAAPESGGGSEAGRSGGTPRRSCPVAGALATKDARVPYGAGLAAASGASGEGGVGAAAAVDAATRAERRSDGGWLPCKGEAQTWVRACATTQTGGGVAGGSLEKRRALGFDCRVRSATCRSRAGARGARGVGRGQRRGKVSQQHQAIRLRCLRKRCMKSRT
jgi:hypothetical protein